MKKTNIVLTGGGTGGHIYPCLAIAEELREQAPNSKLYYIGNHNKLEASLLSNDDCKDSQGQTYRQYINFIGIEAWPFVNKINPWKILGWLWHFFRETVRAKNILRQNKIDIIFGTGGYVAAPVFAAAIQLRIPYIIHNLDAHIGLANKLFINNAFALTTAFSNLKAKPKNGKVIITGNPVSKKFIEIATQSGSPRRSFAAPRDDGTLHLLITGGSQGAESINNAIGNLLDSLSRLPLEIIHVTGTQSYDNFIAKYLNGDLNKYNNYTVYSYTHTMAELCHWADLTVCRSGAMTIAEMSVAGVVPIFVPLPWAAHDHQTLNAESLVSAGAALIINQANKSNTVSQEEFEIKLYNSIKNFCENPTLLENMQSKLSEFAEVDASEKLAKLILAAFQK